MNLIRKTRNSNAQIINQYVITLQQWLSETLVEKNKDILAYATDLTKFKGEPDGTIIVLLSALIKHPITLVHQMGHWNSNLNENHDIVMGYAGHNIYMPSQVGTYFITTPYLTSHKRYIKYQVTY